MKYEDKILNQIGALDKDKEDEKVVEFINNIKLTGSPSKESKSEIKKYLDGKHIKETIKDFSNVTTSNNKFHDILSGDSNTGNFIKEIIKFKKPVIEEEETMKHTPAVLKFRQSIIEEI